MARTDPLGLVDQAALGAFLARCVPPYRALSIELLAGGTSNLTYLLRLDDRRYVLRRRPLGQTAPRAHDMHREFTVLDALRGRGLPTPAVHAYHEEPDVLGAPFYLMDYQAGTIVHGPGDAAGVSASQATELSRQVISTLARLHELGEDDLRLDGFGRPGDFLRRRITSWLRQWNAVAHSELPEVERLGALLLERIPAPRYSSLVHGDYRLGNLVVDLSDGQVRLQAILDWEMATIGDPLTDLAHLLIYWESSRGRITHPAQRVSERPGFLPGRELAGLYAAATGRDLSQLVVYLAFEHWRAAIIKDAIYLRRIAGDMDATEDLREYAQFVRFHLTEAADLLRTTSHDH
ncbi:phosphotransferase family protein [Frankia tisae]|uniref:phosphotransferase family protein n=1 Tax=Frankia tisae TaxID=2950104 RepID=UPI0021C1E6EB|nr:phosphotransferase family protein [Frankia tisae]